MADPVVGWEGLWLSPHAAAGTMEPPLNKLSYYEEGYEEETELF